MNQWWDRIGSASKFLSPKVRSRHPHLYKSLLRYPIVQYDITYDQTTRRMGFNGRLVIDPTLPTPPTLFFIFGDYDPLESGYDVQCVFSNGERVTLTDGIAEIPESLLDRDSFQFQLSFVKDDARFYSLNTMKAIISR